MESHIYPLKLLKGISLHREHMRDMWNAKYMVMPASMQPYSLQFKQSLSWAFLTFSCFLLKYELVEIMFID